MLLLRKKVLFLTLIVLSSISCSTFSGLFKTADKKIIKKDPSVVKATTMKEFDFKLAKLWHKFQILEEEHIKLKEQFNINLNNTVKSRVNGISSNTNFPTNTIIDKKNKLKKPIVVKATNILSAQERAQYQSLLDESKKLYQQGYFGQAIKIYSEIKENYGVKIKDGLAEYWIARCWRELNEFEVAHQRYTELVEIYPNSHWVARAQLDMAKIELKQGLRESAITRLHNIIRDHPYKDSAEMAKITIDSLESTL